MGIEINVTRRFIVNGKQYCCLEDVPPEFSQAIRGNRASLPGAAGGHGEIIVNGKRFSDAEAMPEGVREMYEVAMQCIGSGQGPPSGKSFTRPSPVLPEAAASRWLMLGGLLLCLFICLMMWLLPR